MLFGSSNAHKELRRKLVEEQKLDGVISLPGGVFKPYAGVSTAILLFTKTNSGGTDHVWFYDCQADGWSLDDKRTPLLDEKKLGPDAKVSRDEHAKNNLPDILKRWAELGMGTKDGSGRGRARAFCVVKQDIAGAGYDLSEQVRRRRCMRKSNSHPPHRYLCGAGDDRRREIQREHEGIGDAIVQ